MTLAEFLEESRRDVLARLEAATTPDAALCELIQWHMQPDHRRDLRDGKPVLLMEIDRIARWVPAARVPSPAYMASLDAADGLRLPGYLYNLGHDPDDPAFMRGQVMAPAWPCPVAQGHSVMAATALTLAWLRARWTPVMPEAAHA
jgi:hypothetical protein